MRNKWMLDGYWDLRGFGQVGGGSWAALGSVRGAGADGWLGRGGAG